MKKTYIQPDIILISLQHREQLMSLSEVLTNKDASDVDLEYDKSGGDVQFAW